MAQKKGSITIFALLSLLLIVATLFALLEGTRFLEIQRFSKLQSEIAMESVFANYSSKLWENYHLLGANQEEMETILWEIGNGRYAMENDGLNLLLFQVEDVEIEDYTLLTDGEGTVYIKEVSSYMKENAWYEMAKEIYAQREAIKTLLEANKLDLSNIDEALQGIEDMQKERPQTGISVGTSGIKNDYTTGKVSNPLEIVKALQKNGILELVVEDSSKISQMEYDFTNGVSNRELEVGKNSVNEEVTWMDLVLLQQYLLTYMSSYANTNEEGVLSYELEYLIGGKNSDIANLQAVVTQLLAIREAANFVYLMSDSAKGEEARLLAIALVGATVNPVLIEVVRMGILTAWAFAESILDVRALLAGKKIALLKNADLWTMQLENMDAISQDYICAKESTVGLSYENYLAILLLLQQEKTLALHAMDIQEAVIQKQDEDTTFRMDELVAKAQATITYQYKPVFPFGETLDISKKWKYETNTSINYSYY